MFSSLRIVQSSTSAIKNRTFDSPSPSIGEGGVELRRVLGPDEALLGRDFFEPLHQAKEAARDRLAEEEEDGGEGDKSDTFKGKL